MSRKTSYRFLNLLWIVCLVDAGLNFMTPLWAEFARHIGADLRTAGTAIGLYSVGTGVSTFFSSFLILKIGHKKIIFLSSLIGVSLGFFAYLFVSNAWELYALQIYLALMTGVQIPTFDGIYDEAMDDKLAPLGWGLSESGWAISMGIGAFFGAHLTHYSSFEVLFVVMGIIPILAFFLSLILFARIAPKAD